MDSTPAVNTKPETLTVDETAALLRLGRNATYDGIRRGEIPSVRIGKRILVPRLALNRLLAGKVA